MASDSGVDSVARWVHEAIDQGAKPEQALAFIGLGLMQRLAGGGGSQPWIWNESEDGGTADLVALRQRLELTRLAIQTGAPLSTAEVTQLLGARPGASLIERGGLRAHRMSRNVWKLSRTSTDDAEQVGGFQDGFGSDFRRRL